MITRAGAIVILLVSLTEGTLAQEAVGHIEGRVLTASAQPAASVRVTASGPSLQQPRETRTDLGGYFRLQGLPVGTYRIQLALVGYRPVTVEAIAVRLGRTTPVGKIRLERQPVALGEVVIYAQRPLVDVASAATVSNLPAERFENVPTARDFRSIVSLAPQANLSFLPGDEVNIAGGTGPENAYFLDGVDITDPRLGATSSDLPYNFVRELEVKEGGYEAEYGRATGGIVNVITHSGGNRFGGQLFGFFTNAGLTSTPRFGVEGARETDFADYDVGGSLGGPILRDRLWFFAAYDPSFHSQAVNVPGANLPDDWRVEHLFATKLTWQAGTRTDVVVTLHGDPSHDHVSDLSLARDSVANPEAIEKVGHQGGLVLSAFARHRLGVDAQAELGVARFTRRDDFEAPTARGQTEPHFADFVAGVVSGGLGESLRAHGARMAVRGSVSVGLGAHAVKVGVEYEDNTLDQDENYSAELGSPGGFIFRLSDTTYFLRRGRIAASLHNRIPTAYAEDSWRLGERVTLNYGLRWEGEYLTDANGRVAQSFTDEWQPRVGFTYQLGAPGSQKLFGSYGRFYEQIPLNLSTLYYNNAQRALALFYDHDPRVDPSGGDTVLSISAGDVEPRRELKGQSFDEVTLGYERAVGTTFQVGVRGVYRTLRWAVEDAFNPTTERFELGNPGRGNLAYAPRARHTYTALVLSFEKPRGRYDFLASYVLSRTRGNYEGLYDFLSAVPFPNTSVQFDYPEQFPNSTGLLPNDRRHVFKLSGAYRLDFGLSVGASIAWMSGTPRNEYGAIPEGGFFAFLRPRGSAGRTDAVFDANLRLTYALQSWRGSGFRPKVYLDMFHLGNRRAVLRYDDVHYLEVDSNGNQTTPNPRYGRPLIFQPPMSARVGLSVDFGAGS